MSKAFLMVLLALVSLALHQHDRAQAVPVEWTPRIPVDTLPIPQRLGNILKCVNSMAFYAREYTLFAEKAGDGDVSESACRTLVHLHPLCRRKLHFFLGLPVEGIFRLKVFCYEKVKRIGSP